MQSDEADLKGRIFYSFREKCYNSMLIHSKDGLSKFKGNLTFHLFNSLALMLNNRIEEGINNLDAIRSENDVKLSVSIALMYGNKLAGVTNKSLYVKLDSEIREFRRSTEAVDFYHSAVVLYMLNKSDKAIDYAEKALAMNSSLKDCAALKGWIMLQLKKDESKSLKTAIALFKNILQDSKHLDATLGLVECYMFQNNYELALQVINNAVVKYTATTIPLISKMKIMFSMQNWEQTTEIMNRILSTDPKNLDAIKINILVLLCRDANYEAAALCIKCLFEELENSESGNCVLLINMAQLFSKICGKNSTVLTETSKIVDKAVFADPNNADYIVELGHQKLLQGKIEEAMKYFKTATKIDELSAGALIGITQCELLETRYSDHLHKQVAFLLEFESLQNVALLFLIRAKITKSQGEALELLNRAYKAHSEQFQGYPYSDVYLRLLDPDFCIDIAREYLQYMSSCTNIRKTPGSTGDNVVEVPLALLQIVTKACPGLYEATYLLAKTQYLLGDMGNAINNLNRIATDLEESSDAHLLMAQIHLHNGLYDRAAQSLEVSLSNNFKVRDNPIYHFIDGIINKNTKNLPDAIRALTSALSIIKMKEGSAKEHNEDEYKVSLAEKTQIYLELIGVYNDIGQTQEAAQLLENATVELKGTSEESKILLLSVDQYLQQNNIQSAIDILKNVQPDESCYVQAKSKLADTYLKYQKDKYAYLKCYQEMVETNPGPDSYLLLGDAYMVILEPDEALECYNKALQYNPKDSALNLKMGRALIETHYFAKAVAFYKETIKLTDNADMKLKLAELYFQLKEYAKAEVLLITETDSDDNQNVDELTYLQHKTKLLNLLAQVQEKSGNISAAVSTLKNAKDNQSRVQKRVLLDNLGSSEETSMLIAINVRLAELTVLSKDQEQAINYYKDALNITPDDMNILCALAKLYMQVGHLELCQKTCSLILKADPENDVASVMMADIAFRKVDFDMALFHFTQLVTKQPANWNALVRLVELMRRTGNLDEVQEYLNNAEQAITNPSKDGGFLYCTALYQWYSGNLNGALRNFNLSRQDPTWGNMAIYNMIEICLNPNEEMFMNQALENEDSEYRDSRTMALKTADRLLKELKQKLDADGDEVLRYKLLSGFRLIATKEKYNIEHALEEFISLASGNIYKDHIGITLGIATCYTLLKQQQRAKNQLKRVVKTPWTFEDAEYLERCWLLLADYYIQSTKYESATELLSKVINYNKSCGKAYEFLAFVAEKEQRYKDSSNYYEQAWRLGGKVNPSVGFKLAYSFMKNKKYSNAIDIAYEVLKINPDYPRVKKDILDKALNNLRI